MKGFEWVWLELDAWIVWISMECYGLMGYCCNDLCYEFEMIDMFMVIMKCNLEIEIVMELMYHDWIGMDYGCIGWKWKVLKMIIGLNQMVYPL